MQVGAPKKKDEENMVTFKERFTGRDIKAEIFFLFSDRENEQIHRLWENASKMRGGRRRITQNSKNHGSLSGHYVDLSDVSYYGREIFARSGRYLYERVCYILYSTGNCSFAAGNLYKLS